MSDRERVAYINGARNRGPGKRAIKPSAIAAAEFQLEDEDDSDEDFVHHSNDEGEEDDEGNEEDESTAVDDEEEESSVEEEESVSRDFEQPPVDGKPDPLICSVCMNVRNEADDVVIQCDRCGVAVHEGCYAVEDADSDHMSVVSNNDTEPWFCEPCLFRLVEPPHCELCPVRFGAFKRSDVGGKWVHLVCALYTPGITFGDVHDLSAISWQEIDYKRFGRKPCDGCTNVLEARTGITTGCEAGLCKHAYHISCAQRLGLLVDAEAEKLEEVGNKPPDPHFILCRHHNVTNVMAKKKHNYSIFMRQEQKRMTVLNRRLLNDRETAKLAQQRKRYDERIKSLNGVTIHLPAVPNKRPRLLHSSADYLEAFAEKAELNDVSKEEFEEGFVRLPPSQVSFLPPAFSSDFIRYFEHRESVVFNEETKRLKEDECELRKVKQAEVDLKSMLQKVHTRSPENARSLKQKAAFEQRFHSLCSQLKIVFEEAENQS